MLDEKNEPLLGREEKCERVLSEETAYITTMMLRRAVREGTGKDLTVDRLTDVAGKTGTSSTSCDKWFVGYTPYYICGVWYGYEYPKPITGATNSCVEIWDDVMSELHKGFISEEKKGGKAIKRFEECGEVVEVEYCADSGMLMSEACRHDARGSRAEKGYFAKGTEPKYLCTTHVSIPYDSYHGGIADEDCASEHIEYVGLINVTRIFPMQIYVTDAQYVWRDIGRDIPPSTAEGLPFFANLLDDGEYSGISRVESQFNRYCRADFNYYSWLKRKENG